jgi:putative FmdB family regulatory protein
MPTYVYHCEECEDNFEVKQKFSDPPLERCLVGHEGIRKVFIPASIIFKGSGWYIKDSKESTNGASKSKSSDQDSNNGESKESKESTESTASTESKASNDSSTKTESKESAKAD